MTVVSPDAGGVERARYFAKRIDAPLAIVDKRRIDVNVSEVMHLIGDVSGRPALVVDDIIDTAGTLVKTAEALLEHGATKVFAACTHAVLSGPAVERITKSQIEEVVVTDSVPLNRSGAEAFEAQGAQRGAAAGARNSVDSRRDLDQRTLHLSSEGNRGKAYGNIYSGRKNSRGARQERRAPHSSNRAGPGSSLRREEGLDGSLREHETAQPHSSLRVGPQHDFHRAGGVAAAKSAPC